MDFSVDLSADRFGVVPMGDKDVLSADDAEGRR
jgi:hypothetical protein